MNNGSLLQVIFDSLMGIVLLELSVRDVCSLLSLSVKKSENIYRHSRRHCCFRENRRRTRLKPPPPNETGTSWRTYIQQREMQD